MPDNDLQALRLSDFEASIVQPAVKRMHQVPVGVAAAIYELNNVGELEEWMKMASAIGYFDKDAAEAVRESLLLGSYALIGILGEAYVSPDFIEKSVWPTRSVTLPGFSNPQQLAPLFQSALMLESDLCNGEASALLSQIGVVSDEAWASILSQEVDANSIGYALQNNRHDTHISSIYADYFSTLDHLAAVDDLFSGPENKPFSDRDESSLRSWMGWTIGWRLDLRNPATDVKLRQITDRAAAILGDEFEMIGADATLGRKRFLERVNDLIDRWRMFTGGAGTEPDPSKSGPPKAEPSVDWTPQRSWEPQVGVQVQEFAAGLISAGQPQPLARARGELWRR